MCTPTTIMYSDCVRLKLTVSPCTFIFYHHAFTFMCTDGKYTTKMCAHYNIRSKRTFLFFYHLGYYPAQLCCYKTFKYTFGLQIGLVDVVWILEDRGNNVGRENKKCVWPQIALPSLFLCEIWLGLLIGSFRFRLTFEIKIKYIWHCN